MTVYLAIRSRRFIQPNGDDRLIGHVADVLSDSDSRLGNFGIRSRVEYAWVGISDLPLVKARKLIQPDPITGKRRRFMIDVPALKQIGSLAVKDYLRDAFDPTVDPGESRVRAAVFTLAQVRNFVLDLRTGATISDAEWDAAPEYADPGVAP